MTFVMRPEDQPKPGFLQRLMAWMQGGNRAVVVARTPVVRRS